MKRSRAALGWVLAVVLVSCAAPAAPGGRSAPAAGAAGGAAEAAPGAVATRPPTLSVTVAIPATSLSQFPLTLGKSAGVFEAHGIDLTINQMQTNAAIAAAIAGEVDYATTAGSLIRAIAQGAPLRVVASITDRATHTLAVNPAVVPDGSALTGKRIAINSPGDNTQLEADAAMQRFGLDKKAYTPVTIPNDGPRLMAMQAGAVDAAILSFPLNFQAEQLGFKILVNYVDFYEQPTSVLATSEQKIASQPAAIQRMVEA